MMMKVVKLANEENRERLFVQLWKALYIHCAKGDSMMTAEEMLREAKRKTSVKKAKEERISKRSLSPQ